VLALPSRKSADVFFRRRDAASPHGDLPMIRDLVEIVAIVAAGIWAIYVFVYTDRIEPFQKPVAPVVDASMTVEGAKGDLLAVRISQSIKDVGPGTLRVMGRAANVTGNSVRIPDDRSLRSSRTSAPTEEVDRRFAFARFETAFTYIDRQPFTLMAGQTFSYSSIIYVPRNRYDALILDSSFAYTRDPNGGPASIVRNKIGIPQLVGHNIDVSGTEIQASLWR
jgi:hypothetical protein